MIGALLLLAVASVAGAPPGAAVEQDTKTIPSTGTAYRVVEQNGALVPCPNLTITLTEEHEKDLSALGLDRKLRFEFKTVHIVETSLQPTHRWLAFTKDRAKVDAICGAVWKYQDTYYRRATMEERLEAVENRQLKVVNAMKELFRWKAETMAITGPLQALPPITPLSPMEWEQAVSGAAPEAAPKVEKAESEVPTQPTT